MRKRTLYVLIIILILTLCCSLFILKSEINGNEKNKLNGFENFKDSIKVVKKSKSKDSNNYKKLDDTNKRYNINIKFGIPQDSDITDDIILYKKQYVVSFNPNKHIANWISWNLNSDWYGNIERYNKFLQDPDLPDSIFQANDTDYKNSGYDRGHIVRSEERTKTIEDNISTFYYTNIFPQIPSLNRTIWFDLERYCENLTKGNKNELFIIAGPIFGDNYSILNDNIAIPDSCFKIILLLNNNDLNENIFEKIEVIAVIMPNNNSVRKNKWYNYTTSVRNIENSTGYNFFNNIPKEIQDIFENRIFKLTQLNNIQKN